MIARRCSPGYSASLAARPRGGSRGPRGVFTFTSTGEQNQVRSAIRSFAAECIEPVAAEHDRLGTTPLEVYAEFWRRGFARPVLPEPDGSWTPYLTTACIVAEELAYACPAIASLIVLPMFFNRLALNNLGGAARADFRTRVEDSPTITSFAASERAAGSDVLQVATTATRSDGGYVLDGRKEYSSNIRHADFVIVVARTAIDGSRSTDALSWFLMPTDAPGVCIGDRWQTLGLRSMDLSPLELQGVHVPEDRRLGEEGRGVALMADTLSQSRTGIAAIAVGIARRARDEVLAYGTKRTLYGGKLHKLQDYRFRIAEMEKDIAAARALVQLSALRYDSGEQHTKEASIAKLFAGQMVMRITEAASMMFGSVGYTGQSPIEKLFRDARHTAIVEGTEPTHKELIFASVLRRGGY